MPRTVDEFSPPPVCRITPLGKNDNSDSSIRNEPRKRMICALLEDTENIWKLFIFIINLLSLTIQITLLIQN